VTVPVVDVVLDVRAGGAGAVYTYLLRAASLPPAHPHSAARPDDVQLGDAVLVPLGNRPVLGYALAIRELDPSCLPYELKAVIGKVEGLSIPVALVQLIFHVAQTTLSPLPVALGPATPPGARNRFATEWTVADRLPEIELKRSQQEVLDGIIAAGGTLVEPESKKQAPNIRRVLQLLAAKGFLTRKEVFQGYAKRAASALYRLTADSGKIDTFLSKSGKRKPAQALTLMRLQGVGSTALSGQEIRALSGVTDQTLKALVNEGLLETVEEGTQGRQMPPEPNEDQARAMRAIMEAVRSRAFEPFLLYGVTGSGKTEVFLRAAAECLRQGRQVLYLVPEIALAAQAISQLRDRFGDRVAVFHSELNPTERLDNWSKVRAGAIPVVLGARSAVFAPLSDIGLIVVDEEHETSYKQETSPRYHARDIALKLGEIHGAAVVLGSATPSVESYYAATITKSVTLLTLPNRAATARLPEVFIEDLAEIYRQGRPAILAPRLFTAMEETLARGEQVILFLNRRAYAPFLLCRECGHQFQCEKCAVSLSYSKHDHTLRCHHCDHREGAPATCPDCGGVKLAPLGVGTEKVEEAVRDIFPEVNTARLDRDVARKTGALESILANFRAGEIQVLVGTQMVAKGLDFPNVTLVGVIAADVSLNLPDFRASERTFQLLSQVAGRAGRGVRPGRVIIQTFNPEHVAVVCAQQHDYLSLFQHLRVEREAATYPPFCRLVNVTLTGESSGEVTDASFRAAIALEGLPNATVLGPTDAVIPRLKNQWRKHLLIKLQDDQQVTEIGDRLQDVSGKDVLLTIDVDPYSMI
jgi:primosomal protein N' (replication factor Y) (superfamily II helicase)